MPEYGYVHPISDSKKNHYYLIERQFTADDWHWWAEKYDHTSAVESLARCRKLLPDDVFRLVVVERKVLED